MARLSAQEPFIHPGCELRDATLGRFTEVGRDTRIAHSSLGDHSCCARARDIANSEIGRFSNIASRVRVGATDHPLDRTSLHHVMYRSARC